MDINIKKAISSKKQSDPVFTDSFYPKKIEFSIPSKPYNSLPDDLSERVLTLSILPVTPRKTIFRANSLQTKKKINFVKWMFEERKTKEIIVFWLLKVLLPKFLVSLIIVIMTIFENWLDLDCGIETNIPLSLYSSVKETLTMVFFYVRVVSECLYDVKELDSENNQRLTYKTYIIFNFGAFLISIIIQFYKYSGDYLVKSNLDTYCFLISFEICGFLLLSWKLGYDCKYTIYKIIFTGVVCGLLYFDHYIMRNYILLMLFINVKKWNFDYHQIIFQGFLFLWFQIYGQFLFWLLRKMISSSKNSMRALCSKNLHLIIIKYYLADVICSCIMLPMTANSGSSTSIFGFMNFMFQLLCLYKSKNVVFFYFLKFVAYVLRKKKKPSSNDKLKSIIAGTTNEVMILLIFFLINFSIFQKNFQFINFDIGSAKKDDYCKLKIPKEFSFKGENAFFLLFISIFLFGTYLIEMKERKVMKISWKMESYFFIHRIWYFTQIYFVIDLNFQFYLSLQLLKIED